MRRFAFATPHQRIRYFLGEVRIAIAGYAAEEIYTGQRSDVVTAGFYILPSPSLAAYPRWHNARAADELAAFSRYDEENDPDPDIEEAIEAMAVAYPRDTPSGTRKRIAAEYDLVLDFMTANRTSLESFASALLKYEALEGDSLYEALGNFDEDPWILHGMPKRRAA